MLTFRLGRGAGDDHQYIELGISCIYKCVSSQQTPSIKHILPVRR